MNRRELRGKISLEGPPLVVPMILKLRVGGQVAEVKSGSAWQVIADGFSGTSNSFFE
jgi:hypothetical protein